MKRFVKVFLTTLLIYLAAFFCIAEIPSIIKGAPASISGFLPDFFVAFIFGGSCWRDSCSFWLGFPFAPFVFFFLPLFAATFFISKKEFFENYNNKVNIGIIIFLLIGLFASTIYEKILYPGRDNSNAYYKYNIEKCESYKDRQIRNVCIGQKAITLNDTGYCDRIQLPENILKENSVKLNCEKQINEAMLSLQKTGDFFLSTSCGGGEYNKLNCLIDVREARKNPKEKCREYVVDWEKCYKNYFSKNQP